MAIKKIIDVSSYNGDIKWADAKGHGVQGSIIKIIRKDLSRDNKFNKNYEACEKYGIPWGVYNYSYATTATKAKSDMKLVCDILDKLSKKYFKYGVWFDIENDCQKKLSKAKIAEILNAAQKAVESRGYKFGVYTGMSFFKEHIDKNKVTCKNWWIARYPSDSKIDISKSPNSKYKPTVVDSLMAWQYTEKGRIATGFSTGNSGNFDLNLLYKEYSTSTSTNTSTSTTTKKTYTGIFPTLPKAGKGYFSYGDGYKKNKTYASQIKYLQKFLNWLFDLKLIVDGEFGEKTKDAVIKFQKKYSLEADGKFGPASLKKAKTVKK